jgi:hypothetical protein
MFNRGPRIALKLTENVSFWRKISRFFMMVGNLGRREGNLSQRFSRMREKIRFAKCIKISSKL